MFRKIFARIASLIQTPQTSVRRKFSFSGSSCPSIVLTQRLEDKALLTAQLDFLNINQSGGPWSMETIGIGDQFVYVDYDEQYGHELRIFDPATEESSLFVDVNPGPADSLPRDFLISNGKFFFVATDREVGLELRWIDLNDTTREVHTIDLTPGVRSSIPNSLMAINDRVFFFASQIDSHTTQTLRWLATENPSVVNEVGGATVIFNRYFEHETAIIEDRLFFVGESPEHGEEVFWIDANLETPFINVIDVYAGEYSSRPGYPEHYSGLAQSGTRLFFDAVDPISGREVRWIDAANPSSLNTIDFTPGDEGTPFLSIASLGDVLLFEHSFNGLDWVNILQPELSGMIDLAHAREFTAIGERLYFVAQNASFGEEVHWIDTSTSSLSVGRWDIAEGPSSSSPQHLVSINEHLYFFANGALRSISPDEIPNQQSYSVLTPPGGSRGEPISALDGTMFAYGDQLSGKTAIFRIPLGESPIQPRKIDVHAETTGLGTSGIGGVGRQIHFAGHKTDETYWFSLQRDVADVEVVETLLSPGRVNLSGFQTANRKMFASGFGIRNVAWVEPEHPEPSTNVIYPADDSFQPLVYSNLKDSVVVNDLLFFHAHRQVGHWAPELWWIDTTEAMPEAHMIEIAEGDEGSFPEDLVSFGSRVYFFATDREHGRELRWLDTTDPSKTVNVLDLVEGPDGSDPGILGTNSRFLFFKGTTATHGTELRFLDMSLLVPEIQTMETIPGPSGVSFVNWPANYFEAVDTGLFFQTSDPLHGTELRFADLAHQEIVTFDTVPGIQSGAFRELASVGTKLFYIGSTDHNDYEVHWIDFAADSPAVNRIETNPFGDAAPESLTSIGSRIYFFADDGVLGNELRWIDALSEAPIVNTVSDIAEGVDSSISNSFRPGAGRSSTVLFSSVDGTSFYFAPSRPGFGPELHRLDVSGSFDAMAGNVDRDTDFDANDSFLTQLVMLSGSDEQIRNSKGAGRTTVSEIRSRVEAMGDIADVDGDGDFDANDSFLIHLIHLSAADSQIELSKGASPLTAAEIRIRFNQLGQFISRSSDGGSGSQQSLTLTSVQGSNFTDSWPINHERVGLFSEDIAETQSQVASASLLSVTEIESPLDHDQFREWIYAL